jgi:hypothetical protein
VRAGGAHGSAHERHERSETDTRSHDRVDWRAPTHSHTVPSRSPSALVGPAAAPVQVLRQLVRGGANVARFNMAHGSLEAHQAMLDTLRGCVEGRQGAGRDEGRERKKERKTYARCQACVKGVTRAATPSREPSSSLRQGGRRVAGMRGEWVLRHLGGVGLAQHSGGGVGAGGMGALGCDARACGCAWPHS